MQAHFHNLVILVVAAQLVHQTIPGSSAPIGDENEVVARTTTSSSFPAALTDDVAEQSQDERTSEASPTFPAGRLGWDIPVGVFSTLHHGNRMVVVNRGQIMLRIDQNRVITENYNGDSSIVNRTLAEYYPELDEYIRDLLGPKESDEVFSLFRELDSLNQVATDGEHEDEGFEEDEDEDESNNICPRSRSRSYFR